MLTRQNLVVLSKKLALSVVLALMVLCIAGNVSTAAATNVTILDVDLEQIDLSNPTLISGDAETEGAVYRYDNVITKNGVTVYATVEILEQVNATLGEFDAEGDGQNPERFEPTISTSSNSGGYFKFKFSFFDTATEEPAYLHGFALTAVDIDDGT